MRRGADFVVARTLPELVAGMNKLTAEPLIELADLERQIVARDREIDNPFTKDLQVMAIRNARRSRGERLARTAAPHKILDPKAGPLIAVRLNILTRKTLGGLQTDLSGRVLDRDTPPRPVPGLFAAGEVAGFGGGGMHGYRSLEGSFLGGCLFSGRQAGRAVAVETGALRRLLISAVRLATARRRRYLRVSGQPVVDQRHDQGHVRGDQRARDDRAQPVAQHVR